VAGAVFVLAGEGGREGVCVGDVTVERRVQAVRVLMWEAMRDEDGELVHHVWVRAKQFSKVEMRNGWPFAFRAELGSSAVTQLGDCCSDCTQAVLIHFF